MRTRFAVVLGLSYVAFGVAIVLLLEKSYQIDARYLEIPAGVVIAVLFLGHLGVIRKLRMKRMYRDLRDQYPVVYGCGVHASTKTYCVTSDRDDITIWEYRRKREYAVVYRMARVATIFRRELVRVSQSKKYEALVVENGRPEGLTYMLLYRGYSGSALFPLKGVALETAGRQLSKGAADAG